MKQERTIRIFISSTFKDMHSERDYLVKFVFPELKERCMKRGLHLVDVDLRWGVTEEEAEHGKVLDICLDEIENCRPFFIGLLGERYGWTPDNYEVPNHQKYDWLKTFEKGHSVTALEIYHGVLKNPEMKTRAFFFFRDSEFINDVPQNKRNEVTAESLEAGKKLCQLKETIKDAFKLHEVHWHINDNYHCSYKGLYVNWPQVKADIGDKLSKQNIKLLTETTSADNLVDNTTYAKLNKKQREIIDQYGTVYLKGLEEFGNEVRDKIWDAIQAEYAEEEAEANPLAIESGYHERFINLRTRLFIGREDKLDEILFFLEEPTNNKPLVIFGEPGSGKSALMAMVAKLWRNSHPEHYTLARFVGISSISTEIDKLLINIIEEIAQRFELPFNREELVDIEKISENLHGTLQKANHKGNILILIDAINQLNPSFSPEYLTWLPKRLPENVKIVVSSIEGEYMIAARRNELPLMEIGKLTEQNCKEIVEGILGEYRKKLGWDKTQNADQMQLLLGKTEAIKPLYLAAACEELRIYPRFEEISRRIEQLPDSIPALFEQVLTRLEEDHGKQLVTDALCLIKCSQYGLLESELLELLKREGEEKLPLTTWARLYRSLATYLQNTGENNQGLINFFHLQLAQAVKARYLDDKAIENSYYQRLADYGLSEYQKKTGLLTNCLLYTGIYLYKAQNEEALKTLLTGIFTPQKYYHTNYSDIVSELFDFTVKSRNENEELLLKKIIKYLTVSVPENDFAKFLSSKGTQYKKSGYSLWALFIYTAEKDILEILAKRVIGRTLFRNDLSICFGDIGNIYFNMGQSQKALEFFENQKNILEEEVRHESVPIEIRKNLSVCYSYIAKIYQTKGEGQKAFEFFEKFKQGMEELIRLEPNRKDFLKDLSACYHDLGQIFQAIGEGQKAFEFFEKQTNILEVMIRIEPNRTDLRRDLFYSFMNIGNRYQAIGEGQKALEFFEKFKQGMEELVRLEPSRTDLRKDLADSFNNIGIFYAEMGEIQKALAFFEKFNTETEKLVHLEPERIDFRRDLTTGLNNVAQIYRQMGENQKALEFCKKFNNEMEDMIRLEPSHIDLKRNLSIGFNNIGQVYEAMGEGYKALEFYKKSLQVMENLVRIEPNRTDFHKTYSITLSDIGQIYQAMGERQKALDFFEKSNKESEDLLRLEPERIDFRRDLSINFNNIGQIYQAMGVRQKALEYYEKFKQGMEELIRLEPGNFDFQLHLAISYWSIICVCTVEERLTWLKKAKNILEPMIRRGTTNGQLSQLWGMVTRELEKRGG